MTEKVLRKVKSLRGRSPSGKRSRHPCRDHFQRKLNESVMWLLASSRMSKITYLNRDATSVKSAYSGTQRLTVSRGSMVVEKVLFLDWRIPSNYVACSRTPVQFGKERFITSCYSACWTSFAQLLCSEIWGKISGRNLQTRAMRPQRCVGNGWTCPQASKKLVKPHSTRLQKFGHYQRHLRWFRSMLSRKRSEFSGTGNYMGIQKHHSGWYIQMEKRKRTRTIQMEKCKQTRTRKQQCTSTMLIFSWQCKSSRIRPQSYRLVNSAKQRYSFELASGQKTTPFQKRQKNPMQRGKLRADRCPGIINRIFQFDYKYISNIVTAKLNNRMLYVTSSDHTRSEYKQSSVGRRVARTTLNQQKTKIRTSIQDWETGCNICQNGWRITEHPVDEGVLATRDNIRKHFLWIRSGTFKKSDIGQKNRIFFTLRRTEIAKHARGSKLQGLLAENALAILCLDWKNFGDSITAGHKVPSEGCESRNNHRHGVVLQDLGHSMDTITPVRN